MILSQYCNCKEGKIIIGTLLTYVSCYGILGRVVLLVRIELKGGDFR